MIDAGLLLKKAVCRPIDLPAPAPACVGLLRFNLGALHVTRQAPQAVIRLHSGRTGTGSRLLAAPTSAPLRPVLRHRTYLSRRCRANHFLRVQTTTHKGVGPRPTVPSITLDKSMYILLHAVISNRHASLCFPIYLFTSKFMLYR